MSAGWHWRHPWLMSNDRDVGRLARTYRIDGHVVAVLETMDEDGSWFDLVVDGAVVPVAERLVSVPSEEVVATSLRRWLSGLLP